MICYAHRSSHAQGLEEDFPELAVVRALVTVGGCRVGLTCGQFCTEEEWVPCSGVQLNHPYGQRVVRGLWRADNTGPAAALFALVPYVCALQRVEASVVKIPCSWVLDVSAVRFYERSCAHVRPLYCVPAVSLTKCVPTQPHLYDRAQDCPWGDHT